ncbi:hypothetical protein ACH5RR_025916, partial [Cinchona calisaya]
FDVDEGKQAEWFRVVVWRYIFSSLFDIFCGRVPIISQYTRFRSTVKCSLMMVCKQ